ncbi:MAG: carboxymuconolactone decarboxylase family protein [Pseudomonadota bacterium]
MSKTPFNPFEDMMKMGQEWSNELSKAMAPAMESMTPDALEKLWPTMPAELMETFLGRGLNPESLDAKTKLLLTLQGLTILGAQAEAQIRLTVRHALEAGATEQEITETIALAAMFGGVPAMTKANELARAVFEQSKADRG